MNTRVNAYVNYVPVCAPHAIHQTGIERQQKPTHRLPADVLDDVTHMVYVDSVKIDARVRARVGDAVEDRRHAAAGTTPVRPEVDKGDAIRVGLYGARRDETKGYDERWYTRSERSKELTTLLNCASEVTGITAIICLLRRWKKGALGRKG